MKRSFLRAGENYGNTSKNEALKPFLAIAGLQLLKTLLIYHVVTGFIGADTWNAIVVEQPSLNQKRLMASALNTASASLVVECRF